MLGIPAVDRVITILNIVAILGGIGIFVYTEKVFQRPLPSDELEQIKLEQHARAASEGKTLDLDKITINLHNTTSRLRFLDIKISILPLDSKYIQILGENKAFLASTLIDVAGDMSPEELNTVTGKILLEDRLKRRINGRLSKKMVQKIYFTVFVVQ